MEHYTHQPRIAHGDRREWAFPAVIVIILILLQSQWNASVIWLEGTEPGALASSVATGDMLRRVLGILLGMSGLAWLVVTGKRARDWHPLGSVLFVWLGWLTFTVFNSTDFFLSAKRFIILLMALLAAAAFAQMPSRRIFAWVAYGTLANLLAGIAAEVFLETFRPWQHGHRFAGLTHPNLQGATLSVGLLSAIGLTLVSRQSRRSSIVMATIFLCGLFLTGSRTCIIASLVATAFGGLLFVLRRAAIQGQFAHVVIVALCALIIGVSVIATSETVRATVGGGVKTERDDGSPEQLTGRVDLWKTCFRYASSHLISGYGYDAFWSVKRISDIDAELGWGINEAHCGYIDLLLAGGVPNLVLYVCLLFGSLCLFIRSFWHGSSASWTWVMIIVFLFVHALTESLTLPVTYPSFPLLVGIIGLCFRQRISTLPLEVHSNREECIHV